MSNPSKAKGTAFESLVVGYMNGNGFPEVERRTLQGSQDKGDVAGLKDWVLELKACRKFDLAGWSDEADIEASNAGVMNRAVIAKRPRKSVEKAYAIQPFDQFVWMLTRVVDL